MTDIIKANNLADISAVRPVAGNFSAVPIVPLCKRDEERERLDKRIAVLEENARQKDAVIAALRDDVARAFEDGRMKGYKAGIDEAGDMQAARLSLLEENAGHAQAKLSDAIASLSRLSALLARDCVDAILGNGEDRVEIINRIIKTQIAKIEETTLLTVELSRQDFPDDESLMALAARMDVPAVVFSARPGMASGDCLMTLRLGSMEVGINQQWNCLRGVLNEIVLPAAQP